MNAPVSSSAAATSADAASRYIYSPEKAATVARSRDLTQIVTNEKLSVAERVEAWDELWGYMVRGEISYLNPDDRSVISLATEPKKSSLMARMATLHDGYSRAMSDSDNRWREGVAFYDSLSEDDRLIFGATINHPLMDGRKYASMDVWRSTMQAMADHQAIYLDSLRDPSVAASRAGQLERLTKIGNSMSHAEVYSGEHAAKLRRVLDELTDRVALSAQAQALVRSDTGQSQESIALMVIKGSLLNVSA